MNESIRCHTVLPSDSKKIQRYHQLVQPADFNASLPSTANNFICQSLLRESLQEITMLTQQLERSRVGVRLVLFAEYQKLHPVFYLTYSAVCWKAHGKRGFPSALKNRRVKKYIHILSKYPCQKLLKCIFFFKLGQNSSAAFWSGEERERKNVQI